MEKQETIMLRKGEKLWNGYIVNQYEADIYNDLTDKIERYKKQGLRYIDLENARFNFFHCLY